MNNPENSPQKNNAQFVLSYELLALLRWLVDNNMDALKKIIGHAISAGLQEELQKIENADDMTYLHELQHSITDFLTTFETLLIEAVSERLKQKTEYKDLAPELEKIDKTMCDIATVSFSLEETAAQLEDNPHKNPKELLFQELLRNWQPSNKKMKH